MNRAIASTAVFATLIVASAGHARAGKLELNYSLEHRQGETFATVIPTDGFGAGDQLRLRVQMPAGGYVYIINRGTSGAYRLLFPDPDLLSGNNVQPKGKDVLVPRSGSFTVAGGAGIEHVVIIATTTRVPELEFLSHVGDLSPSEVELALQRLRQRGPTNFKLRKEVSGGRVSITLKADERDPILIDDFFISHR